jgi:hypothetical protein
MIYKGKKAADAIWEHINALGTNSDAKRKVGFSLQGKTVRRNGNSILKCWIQDIAITTAPINYNTYLDIVKAFDQYTWVDPNLEKTVSAVGNVLVPESLNDEEYDVNYGDDDKKSKKSKKYTEKSLANLIQRQLGYSQRTSENLSDVIFRMSARRRT